MQFVVLSQISDMIESSLLPNNGTSDWQKAGSSTLRNGNICIKECIDVTDYTGHKVTTTNDGALNSVNLNYIISKTTLDSGQFTILYFPPGTYNFKKQIYFDKNKDSIILKGTGSNQTHLYFEMDDPSENAACIKISSRSGIGIEDLKISQDQNDITYEKNETDDYLKIIAGIRTTSFVSGIPGSLLGAYLAINLHYLKGEFPVSERENKTILFNGISNNCWVRGVESYMTHSRHIQFDGSCKNITISGNYFHEANECSSRGGRGYGVAMSGYTQSCLVENNVFRKLRHSIKISGECKYNVIAYNYSTERYSCNFVDDENLKLGLVDFSSFTSDLTFHGRKTLKGSSYNLIEGNYLQHIRLDYIHSKKKENDKKGQGPYNTFFRNKAVKGMSISVPSSLMLLLRDDPLINHQYMQNIVGCNAKPFDLYNLTGIAVPKTYKKIKKHGFRDYWWKGNGWGGIKPAWENIEDLTDDASFYCSSKPSFWTSSSTWPYFPNTNNPAANRFSSSTKTIAAAWNHFSNATGPNNIIGDIVINNTDNYTHWGSWRDMKVANIEILAGCSLIIDCPVDIQGSCAMGSGKLEIRNGGTLILNYSSLNVENLICDEGGTIVVRDSCTLTAHGDTVNIGGSGKLVVNDNAEFVVEANATLAYKQGANIQLIHDNSALSLKGKLDILDNATFSFSGNGFLKLHESINIIGGSNSSIYLVGSDKDDKMLEILDGKVTIPSSINSFSMIWLKAEINGTLSIECPWKILHAKIDGDIEFLNIQLLPIANCEFNNTYMRSMLSVDGTSVLNVVNSDFNNCIGIDIYGGGYYINNVNFNQSIRPISSTGLSINSSMKNITITEPSLGIVNSLCNASVYMEKVVVYKSKSFGVFQEGGRLTMKCCSINHCAESAVHLTDGAVLSMSTQSGGGYNNLSYNNPSGVSAIYMTEAGGLELDQGYNIFSTDAETVMPKKSKKSKGVNNPGGPNGPGGPVGPADPLPITFVFKGLIYGSIIVDPNLQTLPDISATNNQWNEHNPSAAPTANDYKIWPSYEEELFADRIQIYDNAPSTAICGAFDITPPVTPGTSLIVECPKCQQISTEVLSNIPYNEAVQTAMDMMQTMDSTANDIAAINLFHQILSVEIDSTNESSILLAEYALNMMYSAITNAFASGAITSIDNMDSLHIAVEQVLDILVKRKVQENESNYKIQFYNDLREALIYRLAGRTTKAVELLDTIDNCYLGNEEIRYLDNWKNYTETEQLVKSGLLSINEFITELQLEAREVIEPTVVDSTAKVAEGAVAGQGVTVGSNTMIGKDVVIGNNVTIGNNVHLKKGVIIEDGATIGDNVTIDKEVHVGKNTILSNKVSIGKICSIGDDVRLAEEVKLQSNVITGNLVTVGTGSALEHNTTIGDGGVIEKNVVIKQNATLGLQVIVRNEVKIGMNSEIGNNSEIREAAIIGMGARIGSDVIIDSGMIVEDNSVVCDGNVSDCQAPSLPSQPGDIENECDFAIAMAKIVENYKNGFDAINTDSTMPVFIIGSEIQFNAQQRSLDYFWDFGDCSNSYTSNPVHTYNEPGTYIVKLVQTSSCNLITKIGAITIHPKAEPEIITNVMLSCDGMNTIELDKNSGAGSLLPPSCFQNGNNCSSYKAVDSLNYKVFFEWDFGVLKAGLNENFTLKETIENSDSTIHIHNVAAGTYIIHLSARVHAKNELTGEWMPVGHENITSDTLIIAPVVKAEFSREPLICYGDTFSSVNKSTGGIAPLSHKWIINNTDSFLGEELSYLFATSGIHTVILKTTDNNGCFDTVQQQVYVSQPISASFTIPATICPEATLFPVNTSTASDSVKYYWETVDGLSLEKNPSLVFTQSGTQSIMLTAYDTLGCTDVVTSSIIVTEPPVASFDVNLINCYGETHHFIGNASGGMSPYSYNWDFGDGNTGNGQTIDYIYTSEESHFVTLTVTDANSCEGTITNVVLVPSQLVASIMTATDESSSGACDGSASAYVYGGTPPYVYHWNDPNEQNTADATNLCPGDYNFTVYDNFVQDDGALYFDGSNDRVTIPHHPDYTWGYGDFTFEAWFKPSTSQRSYPIILSKRLGSNAYSGFLLEFMCDSWSRNGAIVVQMQGRHSPRYRKGNLKDNNCHYVAAIRRSDTVHVYIDGQFMGKSYYGKWNITTNHDLWVGWDQPASGSTPFHGNIKEVRLWNKARTEEEILSNMNNFLKDDEQGLIGYFHLNEGNGQIVTDYSINGNDGYLGSNMGTDGNDPRWSIACPLNAGISCAATDSVTIYSASGATKGSSGKTEDNFSMSYDNTGELPPEGFIDVYPNPYSESTKIIYNLAESSSVMIEVYDLTGRKITTILKEKQEAGVYEYKFSAKELGYPSGVYMLNLKMNDVFTSYRLVETDY